MLWASGKCLPVWLWCWVLPARTTQQAAMLRSGGSLSQFISSMLDCSFWELEMIIWASARHASTRKSFLISTRYSSWPTSDSFSCERMTILWTGMSRFATWICQTLKACNVLSIQRSEKDSMWESCSTFSPKSSCASSPGSLCWQQSPFPSWYGSWRRETTMLWHVQQMVITGSLPIAVHAS